jgi:pyruvate dehydrogenase E1 component beta subunit
MTTQLIEMREALRQALDEEMTRDDRVFIIGEEVAEYNGAYKITKGLWEKWGSDRVIDTPIAENGFAGLAVGAAMAGLRPVVEFMSFNFSAVAFDQLVSNAFKMYYMSGGRFSIPIVFRGPNGAAKSVSCQHSHSYEAIYALFPGCHVLYPSSVKDAKGLLKTAIRNNNPVIFLENELMYGIKEEIPTEEYTIEIGKAHRLREGKDLTLISYGRMLLFCLEAADIFAKRGIRIEVIDVRSIKPLDIGLIASSVRKTHRAVLVEEGHYFSGICAEIGFQIIEHCFDFLDAPLKRVCQMETPLPYSPELENETIPNTKRIVKAIEEVLCL